MAFKRKEKRKRNFQNFGNCHQCCCNREVVGKIKLHEKRKLLLLEHADDHHP